VYITERILRCSKRIIGGMLRMSVQDLPTRASGCPRVDFRSWHLLNLVNEGYSEASVPEYSIRRAQSNDTCILKPLSPLKNPSSA
jgi:hypothetical protein